MQIEKSDLYEEDKKKIDSEGKFLFPEERCIMCGAMIPEGRQVCIECEEKIMRKSHMDTEK